MAGIQLKKYEPLPNLTVQGNQWQAPSVSLAPVVAPPQNISVPNNPYKGPGNTWGAPRVNPLSGFAAQIQKTYQSPLVSLPRIAIANLTNNRLAASNARADLGKGEARINANLSNPLYVANIAGGMAEGGAPLKKPVVTLTNQEVRMGRALGMKKKDIVAAKTANNLPKVVSTAASRMSPEELAALKPGEQMAIDQLRGAGPTAKAPIAVNAAKNPYKPNVREVAAGDYRGARLAPGQLSHPIRFAGDRLDSAMARLEKKSPQESQNFWKLIEDPTYKGSKEFTKAKEWWREVANAGHGVPVALGHNTNYLKDFALHPWKLKGVTEDQISSGGPGIIGKHSQARIHRTIAEGQQAGLELGGNPRAEAQNYARGVANAVDRLALKKAAAEADAANLNKTRTMDLGYGHTIPLSDQGYRQLKAFEYHQPSSNKVVRGLRTANQAAKSTVLSASQFHTMNIGVLRAGPALVAKGHPVAAAKGVGRMFRPLLPGGRGATERVLERAYKDGMVHKAAELGMPYGAKGYETAGTSLKSGVGHKLVFERQMPMMHDQVVRSIVHDLQAKNIPLNSRIARDTGVVGNATMGFINKTALNISPRVRQGMSDLMLAGQFTPSKVVTVGKIGKRGVAGSYARADVAANTAAALALVAGVGYLMGQKSDSVRDLLLRALVNPAAPTNTKDAKGNTVELRTPLTYTAEISKLLGITLQRGPDGHLHVNPPTPDKVLSKQNPALDWMRSRLSPGFSTGVKLLTNTSFSSKPLYDSNAPAGTKASQAATSIIQGSLPIGVQGLAYTGAVKNHLPGTAKEILNANTPGSNAVLKSSLSSLGFTPRTDQTVGKAKDTKAYFDAIDKFKPKDRQAADAYDLWTGSKKNPVTGKYDIKPTVWDTIDRATALLQNPKALDSLYSLNQSLIKQGQSVDPLWNQPKDRVQAYLSYQSIPDPFSDQRTSWYAKNKSWYAPLSTERSKFFDSLPPGDPNKPKTPIEYPAPPQAIQDLKNHYYGLTRTQQTSFLGDHPELKDQLVKEFQYKNDLLKARGLTEHKLPVYLGGASSATKTATSSTRKVSTRKTSFGGKAHIKGSLNSRKYAVSLRAGGAAPKPRVSVSAPKISKVKKSKVSKPKVTLKKTS